MVDISPSGLLRSLQEKSNSYTQSALRDTNEYKQIMAGCDNSLKDLANDAIDRAKKW